ncbi:Dynamin-related protein 3A [Camellia lanceoleosa]|uniref:Dynamin-related protein 3A n=1 Tax=Camellia lanceoleosa TaxID=1840588 RepID=A0ACC0IMG1_9ERIC|nr:Dynamin-related protein 3A [Camellia lanceoleosa]
MVLLAFSVYDELIKMGRACEAMEILRFSALRRRLDEVMGKFLRDAVKPAERMIGNIIVMEMDLGNGWLIHKICKLYLYIFHQRIAGCLVVESIKTAYRVLSNSVAPKSVNDTNTNNNGSNSSIL